MIISTLPPYCRRAKACDANDVFGARPKARFLSAAKQAGDEITALECLGRGVECSHALGAADLMGRDGYKIGTECCGRKPAFEIALHRIGVGDDGRILCFCHCKRARQIVKCPRFVADRLTDTAQVIFNLYRKE